MQRKKWKFITLVGLLVLMLSCMSIAAAEQASGTYKLGDTVDDFTVTLSDGQEVSLYGLLAEKKVVLLNFWASWCGPCQAEFPYMQDAFDALSDDVGMLALSGFDGDSAEIIEQYKRDNGLTTLPMGQASGLADRFDVTAVPTTVVIDRNAVVCLIHTGRVSSTLTLTNLLSMYTGESYAVPRMLESMPNAPITEAPGAEELSAALNAAGGQLKFKSIESEDGVWPFVPSADGGSVVPANLDVQESTANFGVSLEAVSGDVFTYEYKMSGRMYDDRLVAFIDNRPVALHTDTTDGWCTGALRFDAAGNHFVMFCYTRGQGTGYAPTCEVRNVRLLSGDEASAYEMPAAEAPGTLEGTSLSIDLVDADVRRVMLFDEDGELVDEQAMLYVTNSDSAMLKLRIGAEINADFAGVAITRDMRDTKTVLLSSLEHDDEGYFLPLDLTGTSSDVTVDLNASVLDVAADFVSVTVSSNDETARRYIDKFLEAVTYGITPEELAEFGDFSIGYEGGKVLYTLDDLVASVTKDAPAEAESTPAPHSFVIRFTSADGAPVQYVVAKICDDTTCQLLTSDELGEVHFEGNIGAHELRVMNVPEGYQLPDEVMKLPASGGDVAVVLEKAAQ